MIASALIVLREALEAALVISIVLGATKGVKGRGAAVLRGTGAGALGAVVVALLMGRIAAAASGTGQALFEAGVLFCAVIMLGWHNVWMSRHGRELSAQLKHLGREVELGARPMTAIVLAVTIAVLREGSEIVLFLYGVSASGVGAGAVLAGAALGLAGGAAAGAALYLGLMRVPVKLFFSVTAGMIVLLAAGMASQAAAFLNQADMLPSLKDCLWDTSWLISAESLTGSLLKTLVGYTPNPSGIQLLFYAGTIVLIGSAMKLARD